MAETKDVFPRLFKGDSQTLSRVVVQDGNILFNKETKEILLDDGDGRNGYGVSKNYVTNAIKIDKVNSNCFDVGNVYYDIDRWEYSDKGNRVRLKQKYDKNLKLEVGQEIYLTDYSNLSFYVAWINEQGKYNSKGWLKSKFVSEQKGMYSLLVKTDNESNIKDLHDVTSKIRISGDNFCNFENQLPLVVEPKNINIKSINHRGYNTVAPENTLSAYKLSKRNGFDYAECDVSFTSDNVPVLLHDSTIDRTSNGTGAISSMSFNDVRKFDFGSWKSETYKGEKIPSFEEFIVLCRNIGIHPYIELKNGTMEQIQNCCKIVEKNGMRGKVTWISFSPKCLGYVKEYDDEARLGYVRDAITEEIIGIAKTLQTVKNKVFIDSAHSDSQEVNLCLEAHIPLEEWATNNKTDIINSNPYISGFTTDKLIAGDVFIENTIY